MLTKRRDYKIRRNLMLALALVLLVVIAFIAGLVYVLASQTQTISHAVEINYRVTGMAKVTPSYYVEGRALNELDPETFYPWSDTSVTRTPSNIDLESSNYVILEFKIETLGEMRDIYEVSLYGNTVDTMYKDFYITPNRLIGMADYDRYIYSSAEDDAGVMQLMCPYVLGKTTVYAYAKYEVKDAYQYSPISEQISLTVGLNKIASVGDAGVTEVALNNGAGTGGFVKTYKISGYPLAMVGAVPHEDGKTFVGYYASSTNGLDNLHYIDYQGLGYGTDALSGTTLYAQYVDTSLSIFYCNGIGYSYANSKYIVKSVSTELNSKYADLVDTPFYPIVSIDQNTFGNKTCGVKLPNELTTIEEGSFYDWEYTGTLNVPNNITKIEKLSFENAKVGSVNIEGEWYSDGELINIRYPADNAYYLTYTYVEYDWTKELVGRTYYFVNADGVGYTYDSANSTYSIVNFPTWVSTIDLTDTHDWAYGTHTVSSVYSLDCAGLTNLKTVKLPDNISITDEKFDFYNCRELTSITIPNTISSIEAETFGNCNHLSEVIINNTTIANSLIEEGDQGGLIDHAITVKVPTGTTVSSSTYLTTYYTKGSTVNGYDVYNENTETVNLTYTITNIDNVVETNVTRQIVCSLKHPSHTLYASGYDLVLSYCASGNNSYQWCVYYAEDRTNQAFTWTITNATGTNLSASGQYTYSLPTEQYTITYTITRPQTTNVTGTIWQENCYEEPVVYYVNDTTVTVTWTDTYNVQHIDTLTNPSVGNDYYLDHWTDSDSYNYSLSGVAYYSKSSTTYDWLIYAPDGSTILKGTNNNNLTGTWTIDYKSGTTPTYTVDTPDNAHVQFSYVTYTSGISTTVNKSYSSYFDSSTYVLTGWTWDSTNNRFVGSTVYKTTAYTINYTINRPQSSSITGSWTYNSRTEPTITRSLNSYRYTILNIAWINEFNVNCSETVTNPDINPNSGDDYYFYQWNSVTDSWSNDQISVTGKAYFNYVSSSYSWRVVDPDGNTITGTNGKGMSGSWSISRKKGSDAPTYQLNTPNNAYVRFSYTSYTTGNSTTSNKTYSNFDSTNYVFTGWTYENNVFVGHTTYAMEDRTYTYELYYGNGGLYSSNQISRSVASYYADSDGLYNSGNSGQLMLQYHDSRGVVHNAEVHSGDAGMSDTVGTWTTSGTGDTYASATVTLYTYTSSLTVNWSTGYNGGNSSISSSGYSGQVVYTPGSAWAPGYSYLRADPNNSRVLQFAKCDSSHNYTYVTIATAPATYSTTSGNIEDYYRFSNWSTGGIVGGSASAYGEYAYDYSLEVYDWIIYKPYRSGTLASGTTRIRTGYRELYYVQNAVYAEYGDGSNDAIVSATKFDSDTYYVPSDGWTWSNGTLIGDTNYKSVTATYSWDFIWAGSSKGSGSATLTNVLNNSLYYTYSFSNNTATIVIHYIPINGELTGSESTITKTSVGSNPGTNRHWGISASASGQYSNNLSVTLTMTKYAGIEV